MARLKGVLPMTGSMGDLTFSERDGGIIVKQKKGVSKRRIANDPVFERTRQHNLEFGSATTAGSLIRKAVSKAFQNKQSLSCINRLSSRLMKVLRTDMLHAPGERRVESGNIEMLEGFEFSDDSRLQDRLIQRFEIQQNGSSWQLQLGSFVPNCAVDAPAETRKFCLVFAAITIKPGTKKFKTAFTQSELIHHTVVLHDPITLDLDLQVETGELFLLLAGIRFYERIDGDNYPLEKGKYHCTAIVKAGLV